MLNKILKILDNKTSYGYLEKVNNLPPETQDFLKNQKQETNSKQQAPSNPVKDILPSYTPITRINDKPDSDTIKINIETLIAQIRPQQAIIFQSIYETLSTSKNEEIKQAKSFIVDVPMKREEFYDWVRCTISTTGKEAQITSLNQQYEGQPFFPRLIINGKPETIPNDIRKEIYSKFLELSKRSKCPLHNRPRLMMRVAYTRSDYSYADLRHYMIKTKNKNGKNEKKPNTLDGEYIIIAEETIKSGYKKFSAVAKGLFGVVFKARKHVPSYWVEMGFNLKPIPELVK